jgi:NAD(P)-dependent dehydrogenase (short-subunit alcohol dehydrogenase family)
MIQKPLQNQVVLIVGAGRAPGPALARAFAQTGAIVCANDLSPVLLDPLVEYGSAAGQTIRAYPGDATRGMPLRSLLDEVLSDWNHIDILVNNPRVHPQTPLLDMDEWDWQRTVEMNLNGPFMVTQLVAREMRAQGQGVIINITGNDAPFAGSAAYQASQQGLFALSQASALELMAYNIRVHTLCLEEAGTRNSTSDPEQTIARLATFLCGPESDTLSGQVFRIGATSNGSFLGIQEQE